MPGEPSGARDVVFERKRWNEHFAGRFAGHLAQGFAPGEDPITLAACRP